MKRLPQCAQQKTAHSTREREKSRVTDLDERLAVERMLYEGCPNAQSIAQVASVSTFGNERRNTSRAPITNLNKEAQHGHSSQTSSVADGFFKVGRERRALRACVC
jgi:hypothetical protein